MAEDSTQSRTLPETGLLLIGMGPGTVAGMTLEALEAAKKATHRRYEAYTALWPKSELDALEEKIGSIERVMRPEVEQPDELFTLAKTSLVALLVVGDPLQATTHVDLQLQAEEAGIECLVFHGVSITTIVTGAIGLSNYRFGRQTTLTYPYGGWVATSPLEVLAANRFRNLHTVALLDLDPTGEGTGDQRPMMPSDAVKSLKLMWPKLQNELVEMPPSDDSPLQSLRHTMCEQYIAQGIEDLAVVLCADMGTDEQRIVSTTVGELSSIRGGRLNCLVFPASVSEVEEKALLRWSNGE
ncbi:MAG: diphthine synthase [Candidatus Poseidoniaceae archaeon]|nr:diphthine synthase [Candidatus Poseidoniaceae archaeon]